jgi:hypothetical protein
MAISRAQMASQLTGNRMKKKTVKRKALGGLMGAAIKEGGIANLSPAVAMAKSLKSGRPEGMLRLSPLAQAFGRRSGKRDETEETQSTMPSGPVERQTLPTRGMKRGGKVRGDGICKKGRTKGAMR